MAYSALVSLQRTIDQVLENERFSISPPERKQIISLDKCVMSLQAFLEDFPEKAKNLEARIRHVAAEAEESIEWIMLEPNRLHYKYTDWIAILRGAKFWYRLHKIRYEMDSIAGVVVEMKSNNTVKDAQLQVGYSRAAASPSDRGKTNMVDPNDDLMEIKVRLCGEARQLQVLPIYGMGGIGKTTLAINAFYDQLIMERFQIRVWVTVSQEYNERRILLDLLRSMEEFEPTEEDSEEIVAERSQKSNKLLARLHEKSNSEMAVEVHKILTGRRFLIVMDDIWSVKVLDDAKKLFPDNKNGSRIMLTTRLTDVATYANSSIQYHEIRLMDEDHSWTLLRQNIHIPCELESTGREIAKSCEGLPLAITTIAGVLSTVSQTLTSWQEIAKNVKQSLASQDRNIARILSLSYTHLPHHLKPCFLYMSAFPEDYDINVRELTRLWIAEGFVKQTTFKTFEERAEEYLEDLANRSLIIIKKRRSNGKIRYCGLHDMVRDMCIKLSQEENFLMHAKGGSALVKSMEDQRRISLSHSDFHSFSTFFSSTIRTILCFWGTSDSSFRSFSLLRVLDVRRIQLNSLLIPDQFFELVHLRYLAFQCYRSIPRAISKLQSLQTLIVQGHFIQLPCQIWNMPQLRHVICGAHSSFPDPDGETLPLENLHTLKVGSLNCAISIFNMIPNIRKLSFECYLLDEGSLFHDLVHLHLLEELHIELVYSRNRSHAVLPSLGAPTSLKKLTLISRDYSGTCLDNIGPFPNLEVLKLKMFNFKQQEWTSGDENFPQLKYLLIDNSNLRQWNVEGSHFPRLKELRIWRCRNLREIPDGIIEIPTLELIEVTECRESLADSAKQIEEDARDYGNDDFQVRCIGIPFY